MVARLRGLLYDAALPSTHGITVESFDLGRSGAPDFARVHVWDFGGQDIYHGTHALFFRPNAAFVLVWAPEFESGEQTHGGLAFRNYPLRYWVEYVRQLGGEEASVLVVQTRCDRHHDRRPCPALSSPLRLRDDLHLGHRARPVLLRSLPSRRAPGDVPRGLGQGSQAATRRPDRDTGQTRPLQALWQGDDRDLMAAPAIAGFVRTAAGQAHWRRSKA